MQEAFRLLRTMDVRGTTGQGPGRPVHDQKLGTREGGCGVREQGGGEKKKKKQSWPRGELNTRPIELQSIALPLSYKAVARTSDLRAPELTPAGGVAVCD